MVNKVGLNKLWLHVQIEQLGLELADAVVKTREGFGACRTMNFLTSIIMEAFGVQCIYERNPGSANRLNVRYVGPRDRVLLAEYSHRVVWRAMQGAWDDFLSKRPWLKGDGGKRQAFHLGWLVGVREKVEAIVPPEVFYMAQGIIRARAHRFSSEELIEKLRNLYQHRGFLSGLIIDEADGMPSASAYIHRFGSLIRAYEAVGFTPDRDYRFLEVNKFLRKLHPEIIGQTERAIAQLGGNVARDPATDLLTVNREFSISVVLARCQTHDSGRIRWKVRFDTSLAPDITVAVRLDQPNQAPLDYYLLPRLDFGLPRISLAEHNGIEFESYRFDSLDYLHGMAERTRVRRAA